MNHEEYENVIQDIIALEGIEKIRKKFFEASYEVIHETHTVPLVCDTKSLIESLSEIIVWIHTIILYYKIDNELNDRAVQNMTVRILDKLKRQENMEEYLNKQKKIRREING